MEHRIVAKGTIPDETYKIVTDAEIVANEIYSKEAAETMAAALNAKKLSPLGVQKLRLRKDDIIVLSTDRDLKAEEHEGIKRIAGKLFGHKCVVLEGGIKIAVVRKEEQG